MTTTETDNEPEYQAEDMFDDSDDSRSAFNNIDIQNKLIEPDSKLSSQYALSNFQLGNISNHDYNFNLNRVDFALKCINMPFEKGGFFLNEIGHATMQMLDIEHIMSGSKQGKKFDAMTNKRETKELITTKRNSKGMNKFRRQQE